MNKIVLFLLGFYQNHLSPIKPPCCRFIPTCSEYAVQAFRKYGFFKASWLSLRRLLRCHPLCKGGYDPLP
ncbi:MAG: membrane protein insertion efficiency factor YidD [Clostridia bacterium]|nr:membrane protein insertion efficiency factor YidD [Clostridia bacterium]